jgi:hypothetical protein
MSFENESWIQSLSISFTGFLFIVMFIWIHPGIFSCTPTASKKSQRNPQRLVKY